MGLGLTTCCHTSGGVGPGGGTQFECCVYKLQWTTTDSTFNGLSTSWAGAQQTQSELLLIVYWSGENPCMLVWWERKAELQWIYLVTFHHCSKSRLGLLEWVIFWLNFLKNLLQSHKGVKVFWRLMYNNRFVSETSERSCRKNLHG